MAAGQSRDDRLKITLEQRGRYESRSGNAFGKDPDLETGLVRTRLGLSFKPAAWLKLSGMVQDSRAPWYGRNAPNTVRDPADLQEAYLELFPERSRFGMTAGRMMLNYGDGRLIGTPQWGNLARTYDHARVYYRSARARIELLLISPVKIRIGEFNRPDLSDRVWGMYDSFPNLWGKNLLEAYFLRHERKADNWRLNTVGFRAAGPLPSGARYVLEAAGQSRGGKGFVTTLSRRWIAAGKQLDVSGEYKFASPSFDQLYPANHDKFGHEDLFGWKNLHNLRGLAVLGLTKALAMNFMYDNYWLASVRDGLYNGSAKMIARPIGTGARHVGQETDVFATYRYQHFLFGAGCGHLFVGGYLRQATPGVGPTYLYVFHTYTL